MQNSFETTADLYNNQASHWVRLEPSALSDFTARPIILERCQPVAGLNVLDLGCGEGYCSRALRRLGAGSVYGVDISEGMIEAARNQDAKDQLGIHYEVGCVTDLDRFPDQSFDLAIAVFLFNYLTIAKMQQVMTEVIRLLRPEGRFIFSVPHPAFPYMRQPGFPFYFEVPQQSYFTGKDQLFSGRIWKRDGSELQVQLFHKTLEDYFTALQAVGFEKMPTLLELRVTPELIALDADFFQPLIDLPLHLVFEVRR